MKTRFFTSILILLAMLGCSETPEQAYQRLNREATGHYEKNAYRQAIKKWKRALAIDPADTEVLRNIGTACLKLYELQKAKEAFSQVVHRSPEDVNAWIELAKIDILLGEIRSAEAICGQNMEHASDNAALLVLRGDIDFLKKEYLLSEQSYRSALKIDPDFLFAAARLALCLLTQREIADSRRIFDSLLEKKPENPDVLLQIAAYCDAVGETGDAEKWLQSIVASDPGNVAHKLVLADFYLEHSKLDDALAVLEKVIERHPSHRDARKRLVDVAILKGDLRKVDTVLGRLFKENSESIDILLLKGKYHLMRWEPNLAVVYLKMVADKEPNFPMAHYLLGLAYFAGGRNQLGFQSVTRSLTLDTGFTDAELVLADYHYKTREYDVAWQYVDRVIAKEPENERAYMIRGAIKLAGGEFEQALQDFHSALTIRPDTIAANYYRALAFEAMGRHEAAESILRDVTDKCPNCYNANERLLDLLIQTKRSDEAIRYFKKQRQRWPENYQVHHCLGEALCDAGELDSARECFKRSIDLNRHSGPDYLRLASIYREEKRYDEEISVLQQAVNVLPKMEHVWMRLADAHQRGGDLDKALEILEHASAAIPDSVFLQNNTAALLLEKGRDLNRALDLAKAAYEVFPNDPAVCDTVGWAYYQKGLYSQAVWYLKEAEKAKFPEVTCGTDDFEGFSADEKTKLASLYYHLGMALQKSGDIDEAQEKLDMARMLGQGS